MFIRDNITTLRKQFPALANDGIYLDGPGGSQVPLSVTQAMQEYLLSGNSNLGGCFKSSQRTVELTDKARQYAQTFLNAESPTSIVFGANMTTLSFHLSRIISRQWKKDDEVIVTSLILFKCLFMG